MLIFLTFLETLLTENKRLFGPAQAGSVVDYEARLDKIPGATVTGCSRNAKMSYVEEQFTKEQTEDLPGSSFDVICSSRHQVTL